MGFITELGRAFWREIAEQTAIQEAVGLSHSNDDAPRKGGGVKGLGYLVYFHTEQLNKVGMIPGESIRNPKALPLNLESISTL